MRETTARNGIVLGKCTEGGDEGVQRNRIEMKGVEVGGRKRLDFGVMREEGGGGLGVQGTSYQARSYHPETSLHSVQQRG